jgi:hypothetical protein
MELLGHFKSFVVNRWIPSTSSGAVEAVEDRRQMNVEFRSQHVPQPACSPAATFAASEQSLHLVG